jgi:hypothetical protein
MRATSILNPQPRLRHPSERRPRHRAAAQDDDDPRAGAVHAVQGLLAGAGLCLQAQPSGRAQADQDYGKRSAVVLVAGGAVKSRHFAPPSGAAIAKTRSVQQPQAIRLAISQLCAEALECVFQSLIDEQQSLEGSVSPSQAATMSSTSCSYSSISWFVSVRDMQATSKQKPSIG